MNPIKDAFEAGVQFAYLNLHKNLHPLHIRAYATKATVPDAFLSGYLKVKNSR